MESVASLLKLCAEGRGGWVLRLLVAPHVQRVIILDAGTQITQLPPSFFCLTGKRAWILDACEGTGPI